MGPVGRYVHHFPFGALIHFDVFFRLGIEAMNRATFPSDDIEEKATIVR